MRRSILLLLPMGIAACPPPVIEPYETAEPQDSDTSEETGEPRVDEDSDGYTACVTGDDPAQCDCDDTNALINPGRNEIWYDADNIDENCDGNTADQDGDGYPWWGVNLGEDCNDTDKNIHPGAADVAYDGIDANCDRMCDYDEDQDGEALPSSSVGGYKNNTATAWDGTFTYCDDGNDCEDDDPLIHSGADEVVDAHDNDCDGSTGFWEDYSDVIQVLGPTGTTHLYGHQLDVLDVNADGAGELWFSAPFFSDAGGGLVVGSDGANLANFANTTVGYASDATKVIGDQVSVLGYQLLIADLNRDGDPEVLYNYEQSGDNGTIGGLQVLTGTARSGNNLQFSEVHGGVVGGSQYSLFQTGIAVVDDGSNTHILLSSPAQGRVLGYPAGLVMSGTTDNEARLVIEGGQATFGLDNALASQDLLNDDGVADLLIGDADSGSGGAVYVFDGAKVGVSATHDVSTLNAILGDQSGHDFGLAVFPIDDFNGDGSPDAAVVSRSGATQTVRLIEGDDPGVFTTGSSLIKPAITVTREQVDGADFVFGQDLDGDGKAEVFIGTQGCLAGFSGQSLSVGSSFDEGDAEALVCGPSGVGFGSAVTVGDITGDGVPEIVVSAPTQEHAGAGDGYLYILPLGTNWDL